MADHTGSADASRRTAKRNFLGISGSERRCAALLDTATTSATSRSALYSEGTAWRTSLCRCASATAQRAAKRTAPRTHLCATRHSRSNASECSCPLPNKRTISLCLSDRLLFALWCHYCLYRPGRGLYSASTYGSTQIDVASISESLFNDGLSLLLFSSLISYLTPNTTLVWHELLSHALLQVVGGASLGALGGLTVLSLMKRSSNPRLQGLHTLALPSLLFLGAEALTLSGDFCAIAAGLTCNLGIARLSNAEVAVKSLWETIELAGQSLFFLLLGLGEMLIPESWLWPKSCLLIFLGIMVSRYLSLRLCEPLLSSRLSTAERSVLTWGGMKGGLSFAMALALPTTLDSAQCTGILQLTYAGVLSSLLIQPLCLRHLLKRKTMPLVDNNKQDLA